MDLQDIKFEIRENSQRPGERSIGVISLNRPRTVNAITARMALELDAVLDDVRRNQSIRVLVLTGNEAGFCSGGDLNSEGSVLGVTDIDSGLRGPYKELAEYFFNDLFHIYMQRYGRKFEELPQVTIVAINGWAVGAGLELATLGDIRLASSDAHFSEPAVMQGFVTETGGTRVLPKLIGKGRALEMILTGRAIDAEEAFRLGLVDRVVSDGAVLDEALDLAEKIALQPYLSVLHAKDLVRKYWTSDSSSEGWGRELDAVLEILRTEDNREGIRAFLDKRRPEYRGPTYPAYLGDG